MVSLSSLSGWELIYDKINPISGLLPGHSPMPTSAAANGTSYEDLLSGIIESALERRDSQKRV